MKTSIGLIILLSVLGILPTTSSLAGTPGSMGIKGDAKDVATVHQPGIALIGGGGNVIPAFQWMIGRSGGGDAVVLTASGNAGYNEDIFMLGGINSVETLNITPGISGQRLLGTNSSECGDVIHFRRRSKPVHALMEKYKTQCSDQLSLLEKKVPVGGTSAGCAVLTGFLLYRRKRKCCLGLRINGSFHQTVTVYNNDFLHAPWLTNVLSDQHYSARKREGRHVTFMARIVHDYHVFPKGIAPDERTAVCIDEKGFAKVVGEGNAYFISTATAPELCSPQKPLQWNNNKNALRVYEIQGTSKGNGYFSVKDFDQQKARGDHWRWWWVENGTLFRE